MDYLLLRQMFEDPFEKMNEAEERKSRFLLKIAREVERMIRNRSNLDRFRQQVIVFVKGCQISLGLREPNKDDVSIHPPYILDPVLQDGCPKEWPKPQKKEHLLPDYYFLLQLIHDNLLSQPQFIPINNGFYTMEDDWVKCCWQYYRRHATDSKEKGLIETALEHVKVDLAEKPAEREQKDEGIKIMITSRTSKENWEAIRSEYDISKNNFGRKINFVSDSFKRTIIFRDVEQAFVLASQGFSKPALILAGGVIEELLRLYLEHKNIKPKNNMFVDYIKACEDNGLLKRGVSRLSDSVRNFRNLVHLENEKARRDTVSKATAKGAVSSIFTIANDFQ